MTTILCFYHSPCNDGAASAAALQYRLQEAGYLGDDRDIRFCPLTYTTDWDAPFAEQYLENVVQPNHPVGEIFMVDVAFSSTKYHQLIAYLRSEDRLAADGPRVICIDHHVSLLERIDELKTFCDEPYVQIGPGLSGATLVWKYFNERFNVDIEAPVLLRYVADQDIWEWKLPDSKEVNAALNILHGTVEDMEAELNESLRSPEQWLEARRRSGEAIIAMVDSQVHRSARNVVDLAIDNGRSRLLVVNATSFSSELGNYLCEHHDDTPNAVALIYTIQEDWSVRCSLRSVDGGSINARQIAQRFGGGGHDHAAGCRFESFERLRVAIEQLEASSPETHTG